MVLVIPALGILFFLALSLVALVLLGIVWGMGGLIIGLTHLTALVTRRRSRPKAPRKTPVSPRVSPKRKIPPARDKSETKARDASDIWPKWTPSHRQYMAREQSLWQEQFDALDSRG